MCPADMKKSVTKEGWVQTLLCQIKKRSRRDSQGAELLTAILGPRVFLCGKKRFARCFSDASVVLPNAASEHCQDLDSLGSYSQTKYGWRGQKKKKKQQLSDQMVLMLS